MASFSMLENIQSFTMLQSKFPILFRWKNLLNSYIFLFVKLFFCQYYYD
jgi:hypothetical protein